MLLNWLRNKWHSFVNNHLVSDFPDEIPAFCFDCNEGSCEGCCKKEEHQKGG